MRGKKDLRDHFTIEDTDMNEQVVFALVPGDDVF